MLGENLERHATAWFPTMRETRVQRIGAGCKVHLADGELRLERLVVVRPAVAGTVRDLNRPRPRTEGRIMRLLPSQKASIRLSKSFGEEPRSVRQEAMSVDIQLTKIEAILGTDRIGGRQQP